MTPSKRKGTDFEGIVLAGLREGLGDSKIHRSVLHGTKDVGDFVNVETNRVATVAVAIAVPDEGSQVVVEAKNHRQLSLGAVIEEANVEAKNAGTDIGVVVHKRRGSRDPMKQFVSMDFATFCRLVSTRQTV